MESANTQISDRIIGTFTKQSWGGRKGNDAIYSGEEKFDATNSILLLSHSELIELQDHSEETDDLGKSCVDWDGPCEVEVVGSIRGYFKVNDLRDITEAMLQEAKELVNPVAAEMEVINLTINVRVMKIPGTSIADFVDSMDYSIHSQTPGIIVADTEILNFSHAPEIKNSEPERPRG